MLTEKLWQAITRISPLKVCLDESLVRDIMVMICKWYCCKDVNASALDYNDNIYVCRDLYNTFVTISLIGLEKIGLLL